jgi:hypothetical protein
MMNIFEGAERFFILALWVVIPIVFTCIGFGIGYLVFH